MSKTNATSTLLFQCRVAGLQAPVLEHRFHPTRKWRFDLAFIDSKIAVEINGGAFLPGGGRHTRGVGFTNDCVKLASAAGLGWRVIPCTPQQVTRGEVLGWIETAIKYQP